ncbi:MAG TPA: hypothetical protein VMW75_14125 [Thermoanaerobaculia bacterium]|nr:hypothetical protein [Thermoanaerobaculia bacterium]
MARNAQLIVLMLATLAWAASPRRAAADSSIGFGLHSWRTVDDLRSEGFGHIRRSGVSYLLSYQYSPGALLKFELDGEYFGQGFGGSTHYAISPQAFVLVGGFVYGGVGIGTIYSKDFANDFSSPFYVARAGINLHLLPRFTLDVNANYHFHAFNELKGVNTGTVTLGAIARIHI